MRFLSLAIVSTLLLAACGGDTNSGCRQDQLLPCTCADGTAGTRECGAETCTCETPVCVLRHAGEVDFGGLPPGSNARRELALVNDGAAPCAISAIRLESCDRGFSLEAVDGATIAPGDSLVLPLVFQPEGPGEQACTLTFGVSDPAAPHRTVDLKGIGDRACLAVTAEPIAFEAEAPGCRTDEAIVTAVNGCGGDVRLDEVRVEGEGFVLLAEPILPWTLAPGRSVVVAVGYRATTTGAQEGRLHLEFDHLGSWQIPLSGTAGEPTWLTDHFEIPQPQVDLLFVIDNGTGMAEHLANLERNLRPFLAYARSQDVDLHLGVTTTGLEPGGDCPGGVGGGEDGRLFPVVGGTPRILTSEAGDEETWVANLSVGACREGPNQVLEAAFRAVTPPASDSSDHPGHPEPDDGNAGFLRPEAQLGIFAITDREDASPHEPSWYYNAFQGLKGFRNTHLFNFHAITGDREEGCAREGAGSAEPGDRLLHLVDRTDGGNFRSICDSTWFDAWEGTTQAAWDVPTCFNLTEPPADLNSDGEITDEAGEIEVLIDGVSQPSRWPRDQQVWWYRDDRSVCFGANTTPPRGSSIEIRYRLECL